VHPAMISFLPGSSTGDHGPQSRVRAHALVPTPFEPFSGFRRGTREQ
jgi:hypothetical protein